MFIEMIPHSLRHLLRLIYLVSIVSAQAYGVEGYYRFPTLHGDRIIFTAEGDLWSVSINGGQAQRMTTHLGDETHARISPDGKTVAFTASYEGPREIYTMPIEGGLPSRWSYEVEPSVCTTWTPKGELVYTTSHFSTLPDLQLVALHPKTLKLRRLPLSEAAEASFDDSGKTVFFVKPTFHGNVTKRYTGGTARKIWRYTEGEAEAVRLSEGHRGECHHPMWWNDRVYFISDRDGTMNLWSMSDSGSDLKQHTRHTDFDVRQASISDGRIVYHRAGDLWLHDLPSDKSRKLSIQLVSDLDQLREKWIKDPMEYLTSLDLHPKGKQIVAISRGRAFAIPVKNGRTVHLSRKDGVRFRDAVFSPDGKDILMLSDETSEFEFIRISADGLGESRALTSNGDVLRYDGRPSPDGKWLAFRDHREDLWLLEIASGVQRKISTNNNGVGGVSWSPDSAWLAFEQTANNSFQQIFLHHVTDGESITLTSDRANSHDPVWHPDGNWIYFLSDRNFETLVGSPWGPRQPEPYFDRKMKLFQVSLKNGLRSPFRPADELSATEQPTDKGKKNAEKNSDNDTEMVSVSIDADDIQRRQQEVPIPPGNYGDLQINTKALFLTKRDTGIKAKTHLVALPIANDAPELVKLTEDVRMFQLSADGRSMLIRKGSNLFVVKADTAKLGDLGDQKIDLSRWQFSINVREDWRQIYTDAWRMERDYFYDPGMHGVDWDAMHAKYLPLVDRVTTRAELSDVIGRLIGELSALHTSVRYGDLRKGMDDISVPSLGAVFVRDEAKGGHRIEHIYHADPDYPDERSPLDHPEIDVVEGDVIQRINGTNTLSVPSLGALLRGQSGQQVRLQIAKTNGDLREVIVQPTGNERALRYDDWEYSRRRKVEEASDGKIGYVHLQAMGSNDLEQWYREFYPVFDRKGLIIDVRHNRGGNIESFVLEKLMRKAWMYWKSRDHRPEWNMQYAFRGHLVVLCDEHTASDGEAFAEGFRRLGLGKVIGTRTWGGEIWLGSRNRLTDNGLARAPSAGVYSPESEWLIEQVGVVPDIEVQNLPHTTFNGSDAQLDAGIQHLLKLIEKDPGDVPSPPPFPDLSTD